MGVPCPRCACPAQRGGVREGLARLPWPARRAPGGEDGQPGHGHRLETLAPGPPGAGVRVASKASAQGHPLAVQCGVGRTGSPPASLQAGGQRPRRLALPPVGDRPRPGVRQAGPCWALAGGVLAAREARGRGGMGPQAAHGGGGTGPLEMGRADGAPRGAGAWPRGGGGPRAPATRGRTRRPPRAACTRRDCVAPHAAEPRADPGPRVPPRPGLGGMGRGRLADGQGDITQQRSVVGAEGKGAGATVVPRWRGHALRAPIAGGLVGARVAEGGQRGLAVRLVAMGEACPTGAGAGQTAAPPGTGGAQRGRRHRGLRAPPAAQQHGDVGGVARGVGRLAAGHGLQREGMAEDTRPAVVRPAVRQPGPGQHPGGRQDPGRAVRGEGLAQGLGGGGQRAVDQDGPAVVEETHGHGAGVESDATGQRVVGGVASP